MFHALWPQSQLPSLLIGIAVKSEKNMYICYCDFNSFTMYTYFMYLYIIFQMSYIYVYIYVTSDLPSLIYILCTLFFRRAKALNITSKLTIFKFLMYFVFRIAVSLSVTSNLTIFIFLMYTIFRIAVSLFVTQNLTVFLF